MTRVPANLSPSLLRLNPHLASGDVPPPRRPANSLDAQRLAGCPPSQHARLATELTARQRHAAQGAAAHAAGQALEEVIAADLDALLASGIVADYQHAEPRRLASGTYATAAGCDFSGVYTVTARGWCVEVKRAERAVYVSREAARAHGDGRAAALSTRQRQQLDRYDGAGGVALVAVEVGGLRRVFQWGDVPWEKGRLTAAALREGTFARWTDVRAALEALR